MKPIIPRRNKVNLVKSYDFSYVVAFFICKLSSTLLENIVNLAIIDKKGQFIDFGRKEE
jgi:uncharacterized protein YggT (Ycf19 family)